MKGMLQSAVRAVPLPVREKAHQVLPRRVWGVLRSISRGQTLPQRAARRARIAVANLPDPRGWSVPTTRLDVEGRAVVALGG